MNVARWIPVDDAAVGLAEKARVLYVLADADPAEEDTSEIMRAAELAVAQAARVGAGAESA